MGLELDKRPEDGPSSEEESRNRKRISIEVVRKRYDFVEQLLVAGVSLHKIKDACRDQFGAGEKVTRNIVEKVRETWAIEERENRPTYKAQAMRRLHTHIAKAAKDKQWTAVSALERLLSDMQGTKEPLEVQINVNATVQEAMLHVVANLTPEKQRQLIEEQRALRALAEKSSKE